MYPGSQTFLCPPGDTHFSNTGGRGNKHFSHTGGDKHFHIEVVRQTFYIGEGGGYDDVDVDGEMSEANLLMSEASKLSVGFEIFRGSEIQVLNICLTFILHLFYQ